MTDSTKRPLKVFLCHASADKPAVRKLYRYLRSKGMDPWLDAEKLLPGQRWETEIPKALYASDAIIVFLSRNSITKEGYVQREIKFALDKALDMPDERIFLIPARLEECEIPESLKGYQWVDLFQKNWNRRLMSSLNERITQLGLTLLSNIGETQPPVTSSPSHAQFISSEVEESPIEQKPIAELYPRQRDISSDQGAHFQIPLVSKKELEDETYGEVVDPATRERLNQEKSVEISHKSAEKKKIISNPKLRQFIVVFAGLLLMTVCIGSGVSYLSNTLFDRLVTITPTNPVFTSTVSPEVLGTLEASATATAIVNSTEVSIPPTPTLGIGSTITGEDAMTLLYVPAGEFTMGSDNGESDEKPTHIVYLDAFWIDRTEVTNKMYSSCVTAGTCDPPKNVKSFTRSSYYGESEYDNFPVIYVDWDMAFTYCEWNGRRLPSEAEWEKAARGKNALVYPWGNSISSGRLNFCDRKCLFGWANTSLDDGYIDTAPVGSYPEKLFKNSHERTSLRRPSRIIRI